MEDGWDADTYEPPVLKPKGDRWEGEDEDDDVKDNWEDEEEEKKDEEKQEEVKLPQPAKKKKTLVEKIEERERKEREERERKIAVKENMKNLTPEEKLAEKLRQQRLQEEADLQVTKETFGVTETSESIDALNPTTQEEFNLLEEAITRKLQALSSSVHYPNFIENLLRNISVNLNSSNLKKLKVTVENLFQEKTKLEKEKVKKAGGKGKPKVRLMEGKSDFSTLGADMDDDYADYL